MSFRFQSSSCVVVGTFNIYIFNPDNLPRLGIAGSENSPNDLIMQVDTDRPGIRLVRSDDYPALVITPERLVVETRRQGIDCGTLVSRVVKALPWTPMKGVGVNCTFAAPVDEAKSLGTLNALPSPATENSRLIQKAVAYSIQREDVTYNLQMAARADTIVLSCNAHCDLAQVSNPAEMCAKFANRYFELLADARLALAQAFGARIEQ